jgi:glycosyltransferase involved in cell wall biosynthesis
MTIDHPIKIAIAGTRGIPNRYGGFEQFAEYLSTGLTELGHQVIVYNPHYHPYPDKIYKGVLIVQKKCPEKILGSAAHFLYDWRCLKDAVNRKVDVVLMCGYGTSAHAIRYVDRKGMKVITNMDGFEWKRAKYNFFTRRLLHYFEKIAVGFSDIIIADHPVLYDYFNKQYKSQLFYIPYGAEKPLRKDAAVLSEFGLTPGNYFLCIARDEPENQTDLIIEAWQKSCCRTSLVICTNDRKRLVNKYSRFPGIIIIDDLYDYSLLSSLRYYAAACIHGHTAGGTNPSLLEAMVAGALIIAHDNPFNRYLVGQNGLYYSCMDSLSKMFCKSLNMEKSAKESFSLCNKERIQKEFNWKDIVEKYLVAMGKEP